MVLFLLFGKTPEDPPIQLYNPKKYAQLRKKEEINPTTIFSIANTLFQFGSELDSGSLKELELQTIALITKKQHDFILIIGFENSKTEEKNKQDMKNHLDAMFSVCYQNLPSNPGNLVNQIIIQIPELKKEMKSLIPWV